MKTGIKGIHRLSLSATVVLNFEAGTVYEDWGVRLDKNIRRYGLHLHIEQSLLMILS